MNKKSSYLLLSATLFLALFLSEVLYLSLFQRVTQEQLKKKRVFTHLTALPDLALSSKNSYIRHRSLSNIFAIYSSDVTLKERDLLSFSISNFKEKQ